MLAELPPRGTHCTGREEEEEEKEEESLFKADAVNEEEEEEEEEEEDSSATALGVALYHKSVNAEKTYKRGDRVTVLGLVCEKMAKRVADVRKESDERQAAMCLARMQVPMQDDTGVDQRAEDEIWEVTEGPAEEYDETEGEDGEGDAVDALLELAQWELVE